MKQKKKIFFVFMTKRNSRLHFLYDCRDKFYAADLQCYKNINSPTIAFDRFSIYLLCRLFLIPHGKLQIFQIANHRKIKYSCSNFICWSKLSRITKKKAMNERFQKFFCLKKMKKSRKSLDSLQMSYWHFMHIK